MNRLRVQGRSRAELRLHQLRVPHGLAALLLGFLLISVQTLGLLHGVLHAPASAWPSVQQPAAVMQTAPADKSADSAGGLLAQLFSGHQNSPDCRLYDVLSQGDLATGVPALLLPLALPVFMPWAEAYAFYARQVALFEARGPPVSR